MLRVLILPGDIRRNFGDTAICLGVIALVRRANHDAVISVWSDPPLLASGFEGVSFRSEKSLGFVRAAIGSDLIVWGGGQLLQANRSVVKTPYWLFRIAFLRLLGRRVVGVAQGMGPFPRAIDKFLAKTAVGLTQSFSVRDVPSQLLLQELGVKSEQAQLSADPALIPANENATAVRLSQQSASSLPQKPAIGISVRFTLHHKRPRLIPFQFLPARFRQQATLTPEYERLLEVLSFLCNKLVDELDAEITFFPMYHAAWESDLPLARTLAERLRERCSVKIFTPKDSLEEILAELDRQDIFIGTPMHSTILSTARFVPTLALYYEPKGRDYFELIGQKRWTLKLDEALSVGGESQLSNGVLDLWANRKMVREDLQREIPLARKSAEKNVELIRRAIDGKGEG